MKILHVLYSGLGGHGNVFFSMVDASETGVFEFEALFNGVENVKAEYIRNCIDKKIAWHFVKKKPGLDIGYYVALYRQIKRSKPQIIFLHGGAAAIPAWLAKITNKGTSRIVVRETQANHLKTKIDWLYLATAMIVADTMVYLSREYQQQVKTKLSFLYNTKKSVVIPNGIDLNTFTKDVQQHHGDKTILGMQSRLIPIKDHLTLLSAVALLKEQEINVHIIIAGDGSFKETLIQHTRDLNISDKVTFTGMLEEKALVSFLQQLDIYIHASLGETMSTAIMQAMACGKPIVASDVPGINNMIDNHITGILVPPKNAREMANALLQLINNPALAEAMANNAFVFAKENYSNKIMLDRYNVVFNS